MRELALSISGVQIDQPGSVSNLVNKYGGGLGQNLIAQAFRIAFFFAALLALGYFLYGGFRYIVSQGDKKELESSRNTMIYSLFGLGVIFVAFLVVNLIGFLFGVTLL